MSKTDVETDDLTNIEIAVYAVGSLGGAQHSVHSEDIAKKCHELAPSRFSWRLERYRDFPDKFIAKSALENAKKGDGEPYVEGIYGGELSKDGWRLTRRGVEWFRENNFRVEAQLRITAPTMPAQDAKRFVKRIKELTAFQQFKRTGAAPAKIYGLADMLSCSPDTAVDTLVLKLRRLTATAELVRDEEITAFLEACSIALRSLAPSTSSEPTGGESR